MLTIKQAEDILHALNGLPAEKITEAYDFILFLRARYGGSQLVDESDVWTEEDLRDFTMAALSYAAQSD